MAGIHSSHPCIGVSLILQYAPFQGKRPTEARSEKISPIWHLELDVEKFSYQVSSRSSRPHRPVYSHFTIPSRPSLSCAPSCFNSSILSSNNFLVSGSCLIASFRYPTAAFTSPIPLHAPCARKLIFACIFGGRLPITTMRFHKSIQKRCCSWKVMEGVDDG